MELQVDEIYTLKLNSGEELVAKVLQISEKYLTVSEPVSIGPNGSGSLGLIPSLFTYNHRNPVQINTSSIALVGETDESIKTKYIEATTGLKVPDKKVILG